MVFLDSSVTARDLRDDLAQVVNRAGFAHERVGITRHGKLAAVMIGVEDLELLERFEAARDAVEFEAARAMDDGGRVTLEQLRSEFGE